MLQNDVRHLIANRYLAVHDARPPLDYPAYCVLRGDEGARAALGYRLASEGPLFLECYLDAPIEEVLTERLGTRIARSEVVEIGAHASYDPLAVTQLWAATANHLGSEARFAVAVLTSPLQRMLRRLGLPIVELAPARPERLCSPESEWGRYYETMPVVAAGDIEAARKRLALWLEAPVEVVR